MDLADLVIVGQDDDVAAAQGLAVLGSPLAGAERASGRHQFQAAPDPALAIKRVVLLTLESPRFPRGDQLSAERPQERVRDGADANRPEPAELPRRAHQRSMPRDCLQQAHAPIGQRDESVRSFKPDFQPWPHPLSV